MNTPLSRGPGQQEPSHREELASAGVRISVASCLERAQRFAAHRRRTFEYLPSGLQAFHASILENGHSFRTERKNQVTPDDVTRWLDWLWGRDKRRPAADIVSSSAIEVPRKKTARAPANPALSLASRQSHLGDSMARTRTFGFGGRGPGVLWSFRRSLG